MFRTSELVLGWDEAARSEHSRFDYAPDSFDGDINRNGWPTTILRVWVLNRLGSGAIHG